MYWLQCVLSEREYDSKGYTLGFFKSEWGVEKKINETINFHPEVQNLEPKDFYFCIEEVELNE